MAYCSRCDKYFRVPPDEVGSHLCPSCPPREVPAEREAVNALKLRLQTVTLIGFSIGLDALAERCGRLYSIADDAITLAGRLAKEEE